MKWMRKAAAARRHFYLCQLCDVFAVPISPISPISGTQNGGEKLISIGKIRYLLDNGILRANPTEGTKTIIQTAMFIEFQTILRRSVAGL